MSKSSEHYECLFLCLRFPSSPYLPSEFFSILQGLAQVPPLTQCILNGLVYYSDVECALFCAMGYYPGRL